MSYISVLSTDHKMSGHLCHKFQDKAAQNIIELTAQFGQAPHGDQRYKTTDKTFDEKLIRGVPKTEINP